MRQYILLVSGVLAFCCLMIPENSWSQDQTQSTLAYREDSMTLEPDQRRRGRRGRLQDDELVVEDRYRLGVRAGATLSPDQFHIGFHIKSVAIAPHLRAQPNFELGFGSDFTVLSINPELVYAFDINEPVIPYAAAGVGFAVVDNRSIQRSKFRMGINVVGGVEIPLNQLHTLMTEVKFGLGDLPDTKITVGITF